MCGKAILENGETLESVPDWYKNQQMRDKALDNNLNALEFVPECYKTQYTSLIKLLILILQQ